MNKQEKIGALKALPTRELAALAGHELKRGRPSAELRQSLVDTALAAVANGIVRVSKTGEFSRA